MPLPFPTFRALRYLLPLAVLLSWRTAAAADLSGEQVFQTKCAVCHGAQGEGTKKHREALTGDKSAAQLSELIGKEMPEDKPGTLSKPETDAVAAYVYTAMYSPTARLRNRPARIELARLTVGQYRQAVADLIGSFRWQAKWDGSLGLKAEYIAGRDRKSKDNKGGKGLERVDPQVNFDFGADSPDPDKIDPHKFSIHWNGSLLAPRTGDYDFIVRTDHACRLWVNDMQHPLIDAWVKSGNDTEYRGTLFLVGGRVYPLRLEFSKSKQGVDDSKKGKKDDSPPAKAFIRLCWQPPLGVDEPIPARQLSPAAAPELFVCSTPFPPDDRSYGWERGTTVSKEWDEATTDAAITTAGYVVAHLSDLAGVRDDASDRAAKLRIFCRTLAERAYRRPLTGDDVKAIVDRQFDAAKTPDLAVKRVVLRVLTSPRFLYREVSGGQDAFDVASRLSFGLWDSIPDKELLDAAASGRLAKKEQVAKQAERMLNDPRAKAKLHNFLLTWVKADLVRDVAKDTAKFPGFDAAAIADLRTSLDLFLDEVLWSDKSDFRQLLLADYLWLDGRLAKFYGANLPADAGFSRVPLDADQRAGVLTHPFIMATFAHNRESSPILRGVFLARGVLAQSLRPPPVAVAPLAPDLQPTLTTRERVMLQTRDASCMACHGIINPLGYTLEHFDAVGRFRDKDNGKPVDASGEYHTRDGKKVSMKNARDLANFLVDSEEAQSAFVEQLFHYLVQQSVQAYGPSTLSDLRRSFVAGGFNIRKLAIETMAVSALKPRETTITATALTKQ